MTRLLSTALLATLAMLAIGEPATARGSWEATIERPADLAEAWGWVTTLRRA